MSKKKRGDAIFTILLIAVAVVIVFVGVILFAKYKKASTAEAVKEEAVFTTFTAYPIDDIALYAQPDTASEVMHDLWYHLPYTVVGEEGEFYQIDYPDLGVGYAQKEYMTTEVRLVDPDDREWSYARDGLEVSIHRYYDEEFEFAYWVAAVYTEHPGEDIGTVLAGGSYESCQQDHMRTSQMAEEAEAIFAVNGDAVGFRLEGEGYQNPLVIRNGVIFHADDRKIGQMCALYEDGSMDFFENGDLGTAEEMVASGVTDVWWYDGCPLVVDGELSAGIQEISSYMEDADGDACTAFGQKDNNHFIFVVVDGSGKNESFGVNYVEMAKLMRKYGAVNAYLLDGGGSSTIWFDGMVLNQPADGIERAVTDIIYVK